MFKINIRCKYIVYQYVMCFKAFPIHVVLTLIFFENIFQYFALKEKCFSQTVIRGFLVSVVFLVSCVETIIKPVLHCSFFVV